MFDQDYDERLVKRGETASKRLHSPKGSKDVQDWWEVAAALMEGRKLCIAKANSNGPYGPRYTAFMGDWLAQHHWFGDNVIKPSTRALLIQMEESRAAIQKMYADLPLKIRVKTNSPASIIRRWNDAQAPKNPREFVSIPTPKDSKADREVLQSQELARLRLDAARRADVDLVSSSSKEILVFIAEGGIPKYKALELRDGLNVLYPVTRALPKLDPDAIPLEHRGDGE
jgi:hypothetical protein